MPHRWLRSAGAHKSVAEEWRSAAGERLEAPLSPLRVAPLQHDQPGDDRGKCPERDGAIVEGATWCYDDHMKIISQRELRNNNATVMDDVERGEAYTVTRRGVPVARIVPLTGDDAGLRCIRPATARFTPGGLRRVVATVPTSTVIDDLRGER